MRNVVGVCLLLTVGAILLASNAIAQDSTKLSISKVELQKLYIEYLKAEGYNPEIDKDGDVQFKREGKLYFINVSENDPMFFRVVLAGIWPIENEKERSQVMIAANTSNSKSKVAKTYTVKDNVWVSIEIFVAHPEDFKGVFKRAMSALDNGVVSFVNKMKE